MTLSASQEHAKTLASVLGLEDEVAASLLDVTVVVTATPDASAQAVRRHVFAMLGRTVARVTDEPTPDAVVEVLIGDTVARSPAKVVAVGVTRDHAVVSSVEVTHHEGQASAHGIVLLIAACYASAMVVRVAVGHHFTLPFHDTIRIPVDRILRGYDGRPVHVGSIYLAGAGAIGNGLLWALSTMNVTGEVFVVDPKNVSEGNLGRCLFFTAEDLFQPKAERLVARARTALPGLLLHHRVQTLQALPERAGAWLKRLAVAVDSRRARRRLQEELPGEVFDASTTGIEEVVVHFNSARGGAACLSCIYREDAAEAAHEEHVAEMLGVTLSEVKEHYVSKAAAARIAARYPALRPDDLVGKAYDTLFKSMCATGQLTVDDGRTVLAPFAFVSVLAGAVLALELLLRTATAPDDVAAPFNLWRVSPWTSPVFELQTMAGACPGCETCGNPIIRATVERLWGKRGEPQA